MRQNKQAMAAILKILKLLDILHVPIYFQNCNLRRPYRPTRQNKNGSNFFLNNCHVFVHNLGTEDTATNGARCSARAPIGVYIPVINIFLMTYIILWLCVKFHTSSKVHSPPSISVVNLQHYVNPVMHSMWFINSLFKQNFLFSQLCFQVEGLIVSVLL